MAFYHCSKDDLPSGTVLEPRFFCDPIESKLIPAMRSALNESLLVVKSLLLADVVVMAMRSKDEAMSHTFRETAYEIVRSRDFADRPGRIGGTFLCLTEEDVRNFYNGYALKDRSKLYRCEVEGAVSQPLDLALVKGVNSLMPIEQQLADLTDNAMRYWSGQASQKPIWEVITHDKVTVVEFLGEISGESV